MGPGFDKSSAGGCRERAGRRVLIFAKLSAGGCHERAGPEFDKSSSGGLLSGHLDLGNSVIIFVS